MGRILKKIHVPIIALLLTFTLLLASTRPADALSGNEFQAGKIISDSVFFNPGPMTATDIQAFLNSKVPACDTNGQKTVYDPDLEDTVTRKAYSERRGVTTPFTCLKDYRQDTGSKAAETGLCNAIGAGNKSAADIIFEVAHACSVNSRVLLVLLQKEQTLVGDDWPWPVQYRSATGYGCPDTAPCDAEYYGFFNQVYMAAWQFKKYAKSPGSYGHVANRGNNILYNPNTACGSSNVHIQNQATAGLYNYTPYQPNQAALNNLYGSGDGCSAYGNRNFWRMFNDWFGSTELEAPFAWMMSSNSIYADSARSIPYSPRPEIAIAPGGKAYVTLEIRNIGNQTWSQTSTFLGTVSPLDRVSPFADNTWANRARIPLQQSSVIPSEVGRFTFQLAAPGTPGSYTECFNLVSEGQAWMVGPPLCYRIDVVIPQDPNDQNISLTSGQSINVAQHLMAPSARTILALQTDGNLVLYNDSSPEWHANTGGTRANQLIMQSDGNLVLYSATNAPLWASGTVGNSGARAVLQSDGNFVIYGSGNTPLWASGTGRTPAFNASVLHSVRGGFLYPKQRLQMANRSRVLVMQTDGNLVLYSGGQPVWATWTQGNPGAIAVMQADGNFVIYSKEGRPLWATYTVHHPNAQIVLQDDGNIVVYNTALQPLWESRTYGR